MKYIFERIENLNIKKQVFLIILIATIISLAEIKFLKDFMEYNSLTKLQIVYIESINNLWIYFIPILGLYLYLSNNLIDYNMEKRYVYKFKSKKNLIKLNIWVMLIYTLLFSLIINILLLLILALNFNDKVDIKLISSLVVSILLQTIVLFIYNLVCLLFDTIFYKNSNFALLFLKAGVFLLVLFGFNSSLSKIINDISLYNFFTISNIYSSNKTIVFAILLLSLIIYFLISFIMYFNENLEYFKIPSIDNSL